MLLLGFEYDCVTRIYALVMLRMLDVAPYNVTVFKSDFPWAVRTFSGQGDQWFTADMDIDFWGDYLLDFTVRAEAKDTAGNTLDPAWEKKIEGLFADLLKFFEWLASVVAAIADLVMKALSFLVDIIIGALRAIVDALLAPIWNDMNNVAQQIAMDIAAANANPRATVDGLAHAITDMLFASGTFFVLVAVLAAISIIETITKPLLGPFGELFCTLVNVVTGIVVGALVVSAVLEIAYNGIGIQDYISPQADAGIMTAFTVAEFAVGLGMVLALTTRPLKSFSNFAITSFIITVLALALSMVREFMKQPDTRENAGNRAMVDVFQIGLAIISQTLLKSPPGVRRWYKIMDTVDNALGVIAIAWGFTDLAVDAARFVQLS